MVPEYNCLPGSGVDMGGGRTCSTRMVLRYHHEPEQWLIVIEGRNAERELKRETIRVSQETYESLEVGDHYTVPQE